MWLGRGCLNLGAQAPTNRAAAALPKINRPYIIGAAAGLRDDLRFAFLAPFRRLVLRAAPRADAALRVALRFAPFRFFFAVIGMSNDSSIELGRATRTPQNVENMGEFLLTMQYRGMMRQRHTPRIWLKHSI